VNINRIIISANLVANPTLREINSGTPVASATIANNDFFKDGDGRPQQVTTFVDVTVWGKSGENFAALAKKGQEIIFEAQLRRSDSRIRRRQEPFQALPQSRKLAVYSESKARKRCQQIARRTPENKFSPREAGVQASTKCPGDQPRTIHSLSFSMTKLMTQLTSVQLIEAALWRELGSTEPQSQDVLRQALADAVSRWLLIRS
jgi:single stranded DNA-binding protein